MKFRSNFVFMVLLCLAPGRKLTSKIESNLSVDAEKMRKMFAITITTPVQLHKSMLVLGRRTFRYAMCLSIFIGFGAICQPKKMTCICITFVCWLNFHSFPFIFDQQPSGWDSWRFAICASTWSVGVIVSFKWKSKIKSLILFSPVFHFAFYLAFRLVRGVHTMRPQRRRRKKKHALMYSML